MKFTGQKNYNHEGDLPKTGVIITNLGTPDAPETSALKRYLREFLSDPRVVEVPRLIWWFILNLVIVPLRSRSSAKNYKTVWTDDGSPLLDITVRQAAALQKKTDQVFGKNKIIVSCAMRYGNPSIKSILQSFTQKNIRNIVVLPLYPQYCAATNGSTFDALAKELTHSRWVPELKFISGYHIMPSYINAVANSISNYIETKGMPDLLLFSYHGIPQKYLERGDPYYCFCIQTTRLIQKKLALEDDQIKTTFQSRFGKEKWLQPYTDKTLKSLPEQNIKNVAVVCPGFSADCLETLEEIKIENKEYFIEAGGKKYDYIPCLNDSSDHVDMMFDLIEGSLSNQYDNIKSHQVS
ncbi:MAG: ferrochelatase [Kordiimonadaceae bacterium]|jgi:ferrochelatase|nr:ferrochelatase [Kordiimonadaceae bacterium]MDC0081255.1 ferrochelatase [Emcibacteraceae bacterium]MBT6135498.1 ferrochelatase [Kordiimonadaceae bacterium]MBT7545350.1 ferrochelatase [Kordiimonadaceae bacterium]MBT7604344.1 ferrochelatase [Kordiimonadaceae bacterium]|tara:strand:+ start:18913 stop:19968 length:1056 start_codon:yes stop_codon:yes gene_type:complete